MALRVYENGNGTSVYEERNGFLGLRKWQWYLESVKNTVVFGSTKTVMVLRSMKNIVVFWVYESGNGTWGVGKSSYRRSLSGLVSYYKGSTETISALHWRTAARKGEA
jgi:hypothetical protein